MFPSLLYKVIDRGLQAMPGSWRIRRQHQDAPEIVLATIRRWKGEPKTLQTESLYPPKMISKSLCSKTISSGGLLQKRATLSPVALVLREHLRPGATYYDLGGNLG
jgi:hypothetical protein